jgi:hypothetical protein
VLCQFADNILSTNFTEHVSAVDIQESKLGIYQGLSYVMKGSIHNQIIGNTGGFTFLGDYLTIKSILFDSLINQYELQVPLPSSLTGTLSSDIVDIKFPNATSGANICEGESCQLTVIIIESPVRSFISGSKEAKLNSILVDIQMSKVGLIAPYEMIDIELISVSDLEEDIEMTLPLSVELDTSNPNKTLSCGYIDPTQ